MESGRDEREWLAGMERDRTRSVRWKVTHSVRESDRNGQNGDWRERYFIWWKIWVFWWILEAGTEDAYIEGQGQSL